MWWFTYIALAINLIIIWFMPKRLTHKEIYVTWFVIAIINLSSDIVLDLYLHLYHISSGGVQLRVHLLEWTLGASYGIIYLNFLPKTLKKFIPYLIVWTIYSFTLEAVLVHINYINYTGWRIWYSLPIYILYLIFLRWHIHYIRK
jgi:hypothetical protein